MSKTNEEANTPLEQAQKIIDHIFNQSLDNAKRISIKPHMPTQTTIKQMGKEYQNKELNI